MPTQYGQQQYGQNQYGGSDVASNLSFELEGTGRGLPLRWTVERRSEDEHIFAFDGETLYQPFEDFSSKWRLPGSLLISAKTNEEALFAFEDSNLIAASISGVDYESFESGWSIGDLLGLLADGQSAQVTTDGGTWPERHVTFSNNFEFVASAAIDTQTFEAGWLLPGNITGLTNDVWLAKFYDGTNFAFSSDPLDNHLETKVFGLSGFEDFEASWRNNENSKFSFTYPGDVEVFFFDGPATAELFNSGNWTLSLTL